MLLALKPALYGAVHCVKSVRIWSYSSPYFSAFGLNTDQNNSEYGHFLRSGKEFHNLGPNPRKLVIPNLTWLVLGVFMFCLYLSLG